MKWDYYKELYFRPFPHKKKYVIKTKQASKREPDANLRVEDEEVAP